MLGAQDIKKVSLIASENDKIMSCLMTFDLVSARTNIAITGFGASGQNPAQRVQSITAVGIVVLDSAGPASSIVASFRVS